MGQEILVIGLGTFGGLVARELTTLGHEVLGCDRDAVVVADAAPHLTQVVQLDATDVDAIRAIGAEHAILSSDLGQPDNPYPMDGWKLYLDMLRKGGITDAELDRMAKTNPATLLGLK